MATEAPFGLLVVDKPGGPTSHEVVDWIRWTLRAKAVGHCGTLDPLATGLLVVCVGGATKLAGELSGADKTYEAEFLLGRATDTADLAGRVLEERPVTPAAVERARRELGRLVGELRLEPPLASAVHVGGRRAHELAREGAEVALAPRPMAVRALEWLDTPSAAWPPGVDATRLRVLLRVSKGTYVRSLATELAQRASVPVVLSRLHRVASGALALAEPMVAKVAAERLEDAPNGAPRHRLRFADTPGRVAAGARMLANLRAPWPAIGRRVVDASQPGPASEALSRLVQGQRLGATLDPGPSVDPGVGGRGVVVGREVAVLVRREEGPEGRPRIAPERVIRWRAPGAAQGPGQPGQSVDIDRQGPDAPLAQK